jgi:O-antigen ligase
MGDAYLNKHYNNFVIVLLLLFPVLINSVKIFGNLILLILVILGIYVLVTERKSPFKIPELKLFSWLTFGYFIVMLISVVQNEGFVDDLYHLGRKAHFALAPLVALAIYRVNLPIERLLLSLKAGLIVLGIINIYQYLNNFDVPAGNMNANVFGDIAVALFFLSIVNFFKESTKERVFTSISTVFGIIIIFLSSSRGSWVSFIILTLVYIVLIYKPFLQGNNKRKLALFILLSISIVFIGSLPNIQQRVSDTIGNVYNWGEGSTTYTSSGIRLEMWYGSMLAVKESPWLGYGYRKANKEVSKHVRHSNKIVASKTHLHNEYITNFVSAGVIGLVSLLCLLFAPMFVFIKTLRVENMFHYSAMGIILCVGFVTFGFTHIALGEEHMNAFYVFFLAFLLPKVNTNIV